MNVSFPPAEPRKRTDPPFDFKSMARFCAEFTPIAYVVESIVRTSAMYTLTAKTGAGKTAFLISTALASVTGRPNILGREVTRGRVAYIAAENPDDLRMRLMVASFVLGIDRDDIDDDLVILDMRVKPEALVAKLRQLAVVRPFALVMIDTLAAFFDGDNANDSVQGGEFMRRLRPITRIAGHPSLIVAAHPVKNAGEDNLVPYGSGAILNEVDGNLTLNKASNGIVSLHWQGKLRGLEFEPLLYRFMPATSPDVIDVKGKEVVLPVLQPATAEFAEAREEAEQNVDLALLKAMLSNPSGSQADWGMAVSVGKGTVNKKLQRLKGEKLVDVMLGKWSLTTKGREIANDRAA